MSNLKDSLLFKKILYYRECLKESDTNWSAMAR